MKKIISCIVLLLCTTMTFAQRVKPTLPEPATIEEGKYYYLWNEEAQMFMERDWSESYQDYNYSTALNSITALTVRFIDSGDGIHYYIQKNNGYYFFSYGSGFYGCDNNSQIDYDNPFGMAKQDDGTYTINRYANYTAGEFVAPGSGTEGAHLYADVTDSTYIKWRLISADNVAATRMMLYLNLQKVGEGFNTDTYDELLVSATATQEKLLKAAKEMSTAVDFTNKYAQKSWSYPLFFINDSQYPWSAYYDYGYTSYSENRDSKEEHPSRLKAVVEVTDDEVTLAYTASSSSGNLAELNVYIDGQLVRTVPGYQLQENERKYYHILNKGVHTIEWEHILNGYYHTVYIKDIYVEHTPTISVSLLEPGSLGTEVLAQVNHVKDVFRLKVKGEMNADDWATIQLMPNLYSADLGEAVITEIPNEQFYDTDATGMQNFHQVVLPEGLTRIGERAFQNTEVEIVKFPSTLKEIAYCAFYQTLLKEALIPESVVTLGGSVFEDCYSLNKVSYPANLTYIPSYCFENCHHLEEFDLPENLETIGDYAFRSAWNCKLNAKFPESLKSIGYYALAGSAIDTLIVPEGVSFRECSFSDCGNLKYAELPTTYNNASTLYLFHGCYNLKTIKLKSPTVATYYSDYFINNDYRTYITLQVPDYLVSAYKLDTYWYNFGNIEGFATSEIDTWTINAPLTLNATARFQGSPNITLNSTLTMKGETGMEVNDFSMSLSNSDDYWNSQYNWSSQVLMSGPMDVKGALKLGYWTRANLWYYIALPFDIKVGDIQTSAQYAIRYYDGANRAATSAASGNWKNYTADDIIPAGTGFVFQTSQSVWNNFFAYDNSNKSRAFDAKDLSTSLQENACTDASHKGWNLVGNPWMTWFNIHTVDFTAPITVYDRYNNRYQAYSIIDDDVALHPTQAFFVQCPEDVTQITFPARGRQLTSEITDQNGARTISPRRLVDVELSNGNTSDQTRVVMNEQATLGYDYGSDAGKFFAEGKAIQLYTFDNTGESYAINERPAGDGVVELAFIAPEAGNYTLSMPRNQAGSVILKDLLLGTETNLAHGDYYFSTDAGTFTNRFVLTFNTQATGIEELAGEKAEVILTNGGIQATGYVQVYALDGRLVTEGEGFVALKKGVYVIKTVNESIKMVIK